LVRVVQVELPMLGAELDLVQARKVGQPLRLSPTPIQVSEGVEDK
jgi:hypothetical protein